LARHGFSTHTPYLARHYRQNLVGSLPKNMPTVVDELLKVREREPDGDTEHKRQRLGRFRPPTWRNTLHLVSLVDCIV
jgi:siroheme synthase (precorrin-2 oxidase/ferrochelatase)